MKVGLTGVVRLMTEQRGRGRMVGSTENLSSFRNECQGSLFISQYHFNQPVGLSNWDKLMKSDQLLSSGTLDQCFTYET